MLKNDQFQNLSEILIIVPLLTLTCFFRRLREFRGIGKAIIEWNILNVFFQCNQSEYQEQSKSNVMCYVYFSFWEQFYTNFVKKKTFPILREDWNNHCYRKVNFLFGELATNSVPPYDTNIWLEFSIEFSISYVYFLREQLIWWYLKYRAPLENSLLHTRLRIISWKNACS